MTSPARQVPDLVDLLVAEGAETGLQVAAFHHGELILDAVAGVADSGDRPPGHP